MWTKYGGDSDDESGTDDEDDDSKILADKEADKQEKRTALDQQNEKTARQIKDVLFFKI